MRNSTAQEKVPPKAINFIQERNNSHLFDLLYIFFCIFWGILLTYCQQLFIVYMFFFVHTELSQKYE